MILDIEQTYNSIESHVIDNQKDIFNLYNTYIRKWAYLSNKVNDVNTGLFIDEEYKPVMQIFIRNKTGVIKTRLVFNNEGNRIVDKQILNYQLN